MMPIELNGRSCFLVEFLLIKRKERRVCIMCRRLLLFLTAVIQFDLPLCSLCLEYAEVVIFILNHADLWKNLN